MKHRKLGNTASKPEQPEHIRQAAEYAETALSEGQLAEVERILARKQPAFS